MMQACHCIPESFAEILKQIGKFFVAHLLVVIQQSFTFGLNVL